MKNYSTHFALNGFLGYNFFQAEGLFANGFEFALCEITKVGEEYRSVTGNLVSEFLAFQRKACATYLYLKLINSVM